MCYMHNVVVVLALIDITIPPHPTPGHTWRAIPGASSTYEHVLNLLYNSMVDNLRDPLEVVVNALDSQHPEPNWGPSCSCEVRGNLGGLQSVLVDEVMCRSDQIRADEIRADLI